MRKAIYFILTLIFFYLLGSFYSLSFNISLWTEKTRLAVIAVGNLVAFAINVLPYIDEK